MDQEKCRDTLTTWLNNAYAMETSILKVLDAHAEDANEAGADEIASMIREHIETTENQRDRVEQAIDRLGGKVSELKEGSANLMGYLQGAMGEMAKDKLVKNAIAEHATEHFEMATYQSIAILAKKCGEDDIARMAEEIADEEKRTGMKIEDKMAMVIEKCCDLHSDEE